MVPVVATIVTVVFLGVLLVAEQRENRRLRYLAKPIASAGFIAVCLGGGGLGDATNYVPLILAGLILGAIGDVALMFRSDRAFMPACCITSSGRPPQATSLRLAIRVTAVCPMRHKKQKRWRGC
jgi:hypothetical protein